MTDNLRDIAEFSSTAFKPFLPEDSQVNPQVYGAELAYWLASRLATQGVYTSYPEYEDWGWYLSFSLPSGSEFAVHCSNVTAEGDRWALHLRRYPRKIFGRDPPPFSEAATLVEAIRRILSEDASITELSWSYSAG